MTSSRAEPLARWTGVSLILFSVLARVLSSPSRIPYWDIDPLTSWTPDTTRTPAMSLLFDALVWLAASLIIWAEGRAARPIAWKTGLLALLGCVGVALHGWILTPLVAVGGSPPTHGDFQSMSLGCAWASAIVGAWALSMAARDASVKRAAAAALLGVTILLAAKGALQVFVEHPRLVAEFNANKKQMLAAQGFQPGSTVARLFERRLLQPEASAWFGLSNVYGSFMAAGTAAFFAFALAGTRAARSRALSTGEAGLLWIAFAGAAFGLALAFSKGAIAVGIVGCALVMFHRYGARREAASESSMKRMLRLAVRLAPIALPLLALLAVIARGFLGERLHELSLYFRWQYLLAAARIIAAHPLFGVGPAGFKDQYLLFKEPTNPEEIESPHCLPIDWLATLGFFGAAWVILWIIWLWRTHPSEPDAQARESVLSHEPRAQARGGQRPNPNESPRSRAGLVVTSLLIFAPLAFSWWAEWAALTPEVLVVLGVAALLWWLAARLIIRLATLDPDSLNTAFFPAATVLATHCMIEVSGILASSAGWIFAAAGITSSSNTSRATQRAWIHVISTGAIGSGLVLQSMFVLSAENRLSFAASLAHHAVAEDGPDKLLDPLDNAATALRHTSIGADESACRSLSRRLALIRATDSARRGDFDPLVMIIEDAREILNGSVGPRHPRSSRTWGELGGLFERAAEIRPQSDVFNLAIPAWLRVAELDPHGLTPPLRLARLYAHLGDAEQAARWARRALEVHANLRLDPLKGLTDAEKAEMERLSSSQVGESPRRPPSPQAPGSGSL